MLRLEPLLLLNLSYACMSLGLVPSHGAPLMRLEHPDMPGAPLMPLELP